MAAACAALSCGAGLASDDVTTRLRDDRGTFHVYGQFQAPVAREIAWEVLTDYHHIPKFVGALKASLLAENVGPYHVVLHQEFEGGFLFFTKRVHVHLDVLELPLRAIVFTDLARKDFQHYFGAWTLDESPTGELLVRYHLQAKQNFEVPFAGDFMNGGVKDLLASVRREMLQRQRRSDKKARPTTQAAGPAEAKAPESATPGPVRE
jgi:hypothetical protein